jgi:hypothetical protein
LPLRARTTKLELTRIVNGSGTDLLLLETPEPLPFSWDVRLVLQKRTFTLPLPGGVGPLPPFIRRISVSVEFDEDRIVLGPFPLGPDAQQLAKLRWFVHAVESPDGPLEYQVYAMRPPRVIGGQVRAAGRLSETIRPGAEPGTSTLLQVLAEITANHVALLDQNFERLFDLFIPLSPSQFKPVATRVLTNATETVALVIPTTVPGGQTHLSVVPGRYRLDFAIDRVRFRTDTPDNVSNYRAEASITVDW